MDFTRLSKARSILAALLLAGAGGCGSEPPVPKPEESATVPLVKVPPSNVKTYDNPPPPPP